MFKDGLAFFPIIDLSYDKTRLRAKDVEMDMPGVSLGLRLACTVFRLNTSVSILLR